METYYYDRQSTAQFSVVAAKFDCRTIHLITIQDEKSADDVTLETYYFGH